MAVTSARLPPPVGPGARIGVAAVSGPVDPVRLEAGLDALRDAGYEPVVADNLGRRRGLFAGTDDERLSAFHRLAADPGLPAIVFARGGHGVLRLLPKIDWALLARTPRAYVGYSDLTPFLNQVVHRLGLVAFHGPMIAADWARGLSTDELSSFRDALAGRPSAILPALSWLREGEASGPLLGGCLSLLTATLGTEWAPRLDGAIVFWEDVSEPLYRVDRMLTHLRLSGTLAGIRGMVVGHCRTSDDGDDQLPDFAGQLEETLSGVPWPVALGLPAGHEPPNWTLALGFQARLDPRAGGLVVEGDR